MTSGAVANPRRTTLATLSKGSGPAPCEGSGGCHNPAVRTVQAEDGARRLVCRTCA